MDWLQTPDGRPGWAYNFLDMGYVVYLPGFPDARPLAVRARRRRHPGQLNLNIRTANNLEEIFTAAAARGDFPQAKKHTQWPGTGRIGDKVFDEFNKTQVQFLAGNRQETLTRDANVALLDAIGTPVILLTHSQGGAFGWLVADARPNLVKAIVTLEPAAPPIRGVDTAKVAYSQGGGLSWGVANSPITYEPAITDAKELQTVARDAGAVGRQGALLRAAGAGAQAEEPAEHPGAAHVDGRQLSPPVRPLPGEVAQSGGREDAVRRDRRRPASRGNGHMMMLEKNSADIAKYIGTWLSANARPGRGENNNRAMPNPRTIPTFAVDDIARKGFFYAGGEYWGEAGRQVMRGAMYTEVWVPRQVRHPNPIVLFHGNGQTGVDWQQTPDGRAGWAYTLVDEGFVVYMVDYPARGRSAYVPLPGPDGKTADRRQPRDPHGARARTDLDERA